MYTHSFVYMYVYMCVVCVYLSGKDPEKGYVDAERG